MSPADLSGSKTALYVAAKARHTETAKLFLNTGTTLATLANTLDSIIWIFDVLARGPAVLLLSLALGHIPTDILHARASLPTTTFSLEYFSSRFGAPDFESSGRRHVPTAPRIDQGQRQQHTLELNSSPPSRGGDYDVRHLHRVHGDGAGTGSSGRYTTALLDSYTSAPLFWRIC
ncbi:hypothetical protein B0H19DRAFT_1254019 [Mycena capillaripes]|nr:hypothetical protein B0H19DRAFT_1254019 [Mycena capillaripes]